jgi:hypothetical protein
MATKSEALQQLKRMVAEVLALRAQGHAGGRLARAQGYVDGYMRALTEQGLATKAEVLAIVQTERAKLSGPAVQVLGGEDLDSECSVTRLTG